MDASMSIQKLLGKRDRLMECACQATETTVQSVGRALGAGASLPSEVTLAYGYYQQAMELFVIRENPSLGRPAYIGLVSARVEALMEAVGHVLLELPDAIQDAYEAYTQAMLELRDATPTQAQSL